ncbi:phage baseplate plug family protein [Izhakiella capsodis]
MREIPLNPVPNQRLQIIVADNLWDLTIKAARKMMVCDIRCNEKVVMLATRATADAPLIPYTHLALAGNFAFITEQDALPWYEAFGKTQSLIFWGPDD